MFSSLFAASLTTKIAGVAIAATAATGGLAAVGVLPAPVQQAVSQAASTVGIPLPAPQHNSSAPLRTSAAPSPAATPTEGDHSATVSSTVSEGPNHGTCASYATSVAASLGMTGDLKGKFVSALAQDPSATSAQVAAGGAPDAACRAAIDKAETEAANSSKSETTGPSKSETTHQKPEVTETATGGTDHSGATSDPGTDSSPASVSPTPTSGTDSTSTDGNPTDHPGNG